MNRFHILKDKEPHPVIRDSRTKNFIFSMNRWQGSIIDKSTITMDIDEPAYKILSSVAKAKIEITDDDSFRINEFTTERIESVNTYLDVDNSKEMYKVTLHGKIRLIGSML